MFASIVERIHTDLRGRVVHFGRSAGSGCALCRAWACELPFIMDARTLGAAPILTLTSREGDLDILDRIDGVGDYGSVARHAERVDTFGIVFHILDLPTLILAKRATGRPRDREALLELELLRAERDAGH